MKPTSNVQIDQIDPRLDAISDGLYRVSIKAIIVRDHQLLMTHEQDGWYSLPGGGMIHGSDIETTLNRELEEELRLKPEAVRIHPQIVAARFSSMTRGIPRANLYVRVDLLEDTAVQNGELEHLWAKTADLDKLELSPSTSKIVALLKSLL